MKSTTNTVKRIEKKQVKQEHILSFDTDNLYPQRVLEIIADSSTATMCVGVLSKFIMGGGFLDKDFYKAKINRKGMTLDSLLRKNTSDFSKLQSFALHVNYNALYEVTEVNYVHVQNLRLTDPQDPKVEYHNKVAVYNDWGKSIKKKIELKDIAFIDFFDPNPEAIQKQVNALNEYDKDGEIIVEGWSKYKGQMFWFGTIQTLDYQLSFADPVLEDMMTQGRMKRFKLNSVGNNFMASHIVKTGKFEDDTDKEAFSKNFNEFQGDENTAGFMHVELESQDDLFDIQKVEIQDYDGLYQYTETSTKESIVENYMIPPVLVFATPSKLGSSTEIEDATSYYNGITADFRLIFEEVYKTIFSRFHVPINPTGDYSIIPFKAPKADGKISPEYFPYYTKNEIRESNGDAPVIEENSNVQLLSEKLQVGGTTSLIALITDPILTPIQKIGTMGVLFGISEIDAKKMLGLPANYNINI